MWFMNASLKGGADTVLNLLKFDDALNGADWVITGEGRFDTQSLSGKAPLGVIERAKRRSIPGRVFCGEALISECSILSGRIGSGFFCCLNECFPPKRGFISTG